MRNALTAVAGLACIAVFCVRGERAVTHTAPTFDEAVHLTAGYSYWRTGDFRINRETPPLMKLLWALPLLATDRPPFQPDPEQLEQNDIWSSGASSYVTRELYALAAHRLAPAGVLQQWLELDRLTKEDVAAILGVAHEVFPHVWLYSFDARAEIVACREACAPHDAALARLSENPRLKHALAYFAGSPSNLLAHRLLDTLSVEAYVSSFPPGRVPRSTDDALYMEYSAPRGNVRPQREWREGLLCALRAYAPRDPLRGTTLTPPPLVPPPEPR